MGVWDIPAASGVRERDGNDEPADWKSMCKSLMASKMTLVMKIKEGTPHDIDALLLDVRVAGKRS